MTEVLRGRRGSRSCESGRRDEATDSMIILLFELKNIQFV